MILANGMNQTEKSNGWNPGFDIAEVGQIEQGSSWLQEVGLPGLAALEHEKTVAEPAYGH